MKKSEVLRILDLLDVKYTSRSTNSKGYVPCSCPLAPYLHARGTDRSASFFVFAHEEKISHWHCFTCHSKGKRLSSLARQLGMHREENYRAEAMEADLAEIPAAFDEFEEVEEIATKPEPLNPAIYDNMYPEAWGVLSARSYLQGRDISEATANVIGLRFDPTESRVLFPVMDRQGDLYGYSGRSILPDSQSLSRHRDYHFKKELFLLGEHLLNPMLPSFLIEGLFAFASAVEVGTRELMNPLSPLGSTISDDQINRLIDIGEAVYFRLDADEAGDLGLKGALPKIRPHLPCMLVPFPPGVDDMDIICNDDIRWMYKNSMIA